MGESVQLLDEDHIFICKPRDKKSELYTMVRDVVRTAIEEQQRKTSQLMPESFPAL